MRVISVLLGRFLTGHVELVHAVNAGVHAVVERACRGTMQLLTGGEPGRE